MAHQPYHHGNLREALIESSLALIREVGPEGFTLREVARRAGVSHNAPYRHFADKSDLLAAVAEEGFVELRKGMLRAVSKSKDPRARIERSGVAYVRHALRHPAHFDVMFSTQFEARAHPEANRAAEEAFAVLVGLVVECQQADVLPRGDELVQARTAWALVHGIATLGIHRQLRTAKGSDLLAFAEAATASLIRGISAMPPATPRRASGSGRHRA